MFDDPVSPEMFKRLLADQEEAMRRSRIRQMEARHLERYEQATWQFQRTWGRLVKMLYREVVALLCRISVFPMKLLCKCLGVDFYLVTMR